METITWPSDWLRGTLSYAVLGSLRFGPMHGYAISTALEGAGLGKVKGGTLYPLLTRLAQGGLVSSTWEPGSAGPGRKVFAITSAGQLHAEQAEELWRSFASLISAAIAGPARTDISYPQNSRSELAI